MDDLDRILELAGIAKAPTIVSASTEAGGGINRTTANRMVDPKGYFQKNKNKNFRGKGATFEGRGLRDYLRDCEQKRS